MLRKMKRYISILGMVFLIGTMMLSGTSFGAGSELTGIAAGFSHSLVVKSDGTVWAWGNNDYGQLGDGTSGWDANKTEPVQVLGLSDVKDVAAGEGYSLAIKNDGTVWAWGFNGYGQLGDGTLENKKIPVQVSGLTDIQKISAGKQHVLALKNDGTVWVWGDNRYGQLGDGTTTVKDIPVQIPDLTDVIDIAAGFSHSLVVKSDGSVWAWGRNNFGELGDGTTTDRMNPIRVMDRNDFTDYLTDVKHVAAGMDYSMVLKNDGTVLTWGYNGYGQLGIDNKDTKKEPVEVVGVSDIKTITAGRFHAAVLTNNGSIYTWGRNNYGQLGDGTTTTSDTPQNIGLSNVETVFMGEYYTLVFKNDGTIWAWGCNNNGQLGNGNTTNSNIPVQTKIGTVNVDPPQFVSNTPINNATDIPVGQSVTVKFNKELKQEVDETQITFKAGTTIVGFDSEIKNNDTLQLVPKSNLAYNTTYTVTIKSGAVQDTIGNPFNGTCTIIFTTESSNEPSWSSGWEEEIKIIEGNPATGKMNVNLTWPEAVDDGAIQYYKAYKSQITLQDGQNFEDVDLTSVTEWTFEDMLEGTVHTYDFTDLDTDSIYVLKIEAGDNEGNWSSSSLWIKIRTADTKVPLWSDELVTPQEFKIGAIKDTIGRSSFVLGWMPAEDNRDVAKYEIEVYKNDGDILLYTYPVLASTLALQENVQLVSEAEGTLHDVYTYNITGLEEGIEYYVKIEAYDEAGNVSSVKQSVGVKTSGTPVADITKPMFESSCFDGAESVAANVVRIPVNFSEPIKAGNVNKIGIQNSLGNSVNYHVDEIAGSALYLETDVSLAPEETYTVTIPVDAIIDMADNNLFSEISFTFNTVKNEPVELKVEDTWGNPDRDISVPIMVSNGGGMAGFQFKLNYNPNLLSVLGVEEGELIITNESSTGTGWTIQSDFSSGSITVIGYNSNAEELDLGKGELLKLKFTVAENAQKGDFINLCFEDCVVSDRWGLNPMNVVTTDGQVNISICKKGDANANDTIDINDIIRTLNIIMGEITPTIDEAYGADANDDGVINVGDIIWIADEIFGRSHN